MMARTREAIGTEVPIATTSTLLGPVDDGDGDDDDGTDVGDETNNGEVSEEDIVGNEVGSVGDGKDVFGDESVDIGKAFVVELNIVTQSLQCCYISALASFHYEHSNERQLTLLLLAMPAPSACSAKSMNASGDKAVSAPAS